MPTTAQEVPAPTTTVERRFYPRIGPHAPIFFAIDGSNEALLLNVGENGLLVSTTTELQCNFVARIVVPLNGLPNPVQLNVRVVWTNPARKLTGIQLLDLSEHDREQIRKWGTQESSQSLPREPHPVQVVASSSTTSPKRTPLTAFFGEQAPPKAPRIIVPPTSVAVPIAKLVVLIAVCLGTVFLVRNGVPGNPSARSTQSRYESGAPVPPPQGTQGSPQSPDTPKRDAVRSVASSTQNVDATKSEVVLSGALAPHNSTRARKHGNEDDGTGGYTVDTERNQSDSSKVGSNSPSRPTPERDPTSSTSSPIAANQTEVSAIPANPLIPKDATLPIFFNPPTPKKPVGNPLGANDVPTGTSLPKPDAPVIPMDRVGRQVLEIQLTSGHHASFFNLPGERVLETPSATIHIQRSIRMPATGARWPFNRNKKVVVGGLILRVDPQAAQIQTGPTDLVRVNATVAEDGHIESVRPIHGPANLVSAVVKAIHEWRYQPTLIDGKPVQTQCYVVVQFRGAADRAAGR